MFSSLTANADDLITRTKEVHAGSRAGYTCEDCVREIIANTSAEERRINGLGGVVTEKSVGDCTGGYPVVIYGSIAYKIPASALIKDVVVQK